MSDGDPDLAERRLEARWMAKCRIGTAAWCDVVTSGCSHCASLASAA